MKTYTDPRIERDFGSQLIEAGILTSDQKDRILESDISLIEYCLSSDLYPNETVRDLFSKASGIPFLDQTDIETDPNLASHVPVKFAEHYGFCPVALSDGCLKIAVVYPLSIKTVDEIHLQLGLEINQVLVHQDQMNLLKRSCYGMSANIVDQIVSGQNRSSEYDSEDLAITAIPTADKVSADRSVINLVNEIILEAFNSRATDIHLEPYRGKFRLRYRIDGVLHDARLSGHAGKLILPIISRIKIMSNLDIVEHRLPQDGRAIVQIADQRLDLRVSCIPTPSGESVVIRVLKAEMTHDLAKLGLGKRNYNQLTGLLKQPHGMILLTGPTGSGKTTTLYACLSQIKSDQRKIISIEDPIEYEIEGITQIQVHQRSGLTFAKGLRSILRHDPDTLMVGEIRDLETAEIAIRAALTGHLIFSTLHTNDSCSGVSRLIDIGVEPFLVSSSVNAIIAQRLVRRICENCKVESDCDTDPIINRLKLEGVYEEDGGVVTSYKGTGCQKCLNTGYYGRTSIHEIFVLNDAIRQMIASRADLEAIKAEAARNGMQSLLRDGWDKISNGLTTVSEVLSVCNVSLK